MTQRSGHPALVSWHRCLAVLAIGRAPPLGRIIAARIGPKDGSSPARIGRYFGFIAAEPVKSKRCLKQIFTFGPRVRTHRRHFLQQCEYSLCAIHSGGDWQFVEHEKADTDRDEKDEFLFNLAIYKFNIPGSERIKILQMLDQYNLNAFSLFGTEESLMKTLAFREFHFPN